MLPSVPFLKPTGHDRPDASSRWTWLSVVRAPIAPQATKSAMYCGVIMSRYSQPAGSPAVLISHQQLARDAQAVVDAETAVHVRVVDQTLPADGGAGLLEVHAHDDLEIGRMAVTFGFELAGIVERRGRIVDRARADDDDQAVVHAMQDAVDCLACLMHRDRGAVFARKLADQVRRRREFLDLADPQIVGHVAHVSCSVHRGSSCCPSPDPAKKNRQVMGLAVRVDSVLLLRAPFDSLRPGPEKAVKVKEVEARGRIHASGRTATTRRAIARYPRLASGRKPAGLDAGQTSTRITQK